jgi:hypothetical protein
MTALIVAFAEYRNISHQTRQQYKERAVKLMQYPA